MRRYHDLPPREWRDGAPRSRGPLFFGVSVQGLQRRRERQEQGLRPTDEAPELQMFIECDSGFVLGVNDQREDRGSPRALARRRP